MHKKFYSFETKKILEQFKKLFDNEKIIWIGQNLKYDMLVLKWYGIELKGNIFDTMLAHYVIEPEGKRGMDLLSAQFLGYEPVHIEELIGKKGKGQGTMRDVEVEKIKEYAAEDADITLQLKHIFTPLLKEKEVEKIFDKWDLNCAIIGEVTEGDRLHFHMHEELVADVPADELVLGGGAPVYRHRHQLRRSPDSLGDFHRSAPRVLPTLRS